MIGNGFAMYLLLSTRHCAGDCVTVVVQRSPVTAGPPCGLAVQCTGNDSRPVPADPAAGQAALAASPATFWPWRPDPANGSGSPVQAWLATLIAQGW